MTIEEAEETLRSIIPYRYNVPSNKIQEAEKTILDAIKNGAHVTNAFGMTVESERRVMNNAVELIKYVVDDLVFSCEADNYDWMDYFTDISEELDEIVANADYPSDFCYKLPSDEWLFKRLISYGTNRGGMTSAMEECAKIGKVIKDEPDTL